MNALHAPSLSCLSLYNILYRHLQRLKRLAASLLLALWLSVIAATAAHAADTERANKVATIGKIAQIDMGVGHSCAVTVEGALWCWGSNAYGQVGAGKLGENLATPARIFERGVSSVSTGAYYTCAVVKGALYCWGKNTNGELGAGTDSKAEPLPLLAIAADVKSVSASHSEMPRTCAVVKDAVQCWGVNLYGELGPKEAHPADSVYNTPYDAFVLQHRTFVTSGATAVDAGFSDICAIVRGSLQCWGGQLEGSLNSGNRRTTQLAQLIADGVTQVSVGAHHTCAVVHGGLQCWGEFRSGGPGDGSDIGADPYHPWVGKPVEVIHEGVTAVRTNSLALADSQHTCAIVHGAMLCWGDNYGGQIDPTSKGKNVLTPHQMLAGGVSAIAEGNDRNRCLLINQALRCRSEQRVSQMLSWPHVPTHVLPWTNATGDVAAVNEGTAEQLASEEQQATQRVAGKLESTLPGKLVSDGQTVFAVLGAEVTVVDGTVMPSLDTVPLYDLQTKEIPTTSAGEHTIATLAAKARCGGLTQQASQQGDFNANWFNLHSSTDFYVAKGNGFLRMHDAFRQLDPLAAIIINPGAPEAQWTMKFNRTDMVRVRQCAEQIQSQQAEQPFSALSLMLDDNGKNQAVQARANNIWHVMVTQPIAGLTITPKPGMEATDFAVDVRVLGTMTCGSWTLDRWKQAASHAWPLTPTTRDGNLLFTLPQTDAQEKTRQEPFLQPYTQAELLHALSKFFPDGGVDLKATARDCHPAIWGEVYTVRYRSKVVEKILTMPEQNGYD